MTLTHPRAYYGWRIAWALAVTQTVGYGVLFYTFSVMIEPMEAELGWSRAELSGAFSVALLVGGVAAIPIGRWVDRHGARGLMTLGSTLGVLLVLLWSLVDNLAAFYAIQAAVGLVSAMVLYEVAFTVIAVWFTRQRIQAMLLVTTLAGFASTIFIPLASFLVQTSGWREGLRWLALVLALTIPLHGLVLRHRPPAEPESSHVQASSATSANQALRLPSFWWMTTAFSLDRFATVVVAAHIVPLLSERGFETATVAAAAGSIGAAQVAGRWLFSFVQRVPLVTLTIITFGFHAAALAVLLLPSASTIWLFAVLFGLANGAVTLARAAMVAELYGAQAYGSINGMMATPIAVSMTAAPLAAGVVYDLSGGYELVLWSLIGVALLAAVSISRVRAS